MCCVYVGFVDTLAFIHKHVTTYEKLVVVAHTRHVVGPAVVYENETQYAAAEACDKRVKFERLKAWRTVCLRLFARLP